MASQTTILVALNATASILCTAVAITSIIVTIGTPDIVFTTPAGGDYAANPGSLVAVFLFISAIEHAGILFASNYYARSLYSMSPHRWISYGISAPIMIVIISVSVGIVDLYTNLFAATIMTVVIATGYLYEWDRESNESQYYIPIIGCGTAYLSVVFSIIWYQYSTVDAPDLVHAIILLMSICYWSFGAIPLASTLFNEATPRFKSEIAYVSLSITSKLILASLFIARYVMLKSDSN